MATQIASPLQPAEASSSMSLIQRSRKRIKSWLEPRPPTPYSHLADNELYVEVDIRPSYITRTRRVEVHPLIEIAERSRREMRARNAARLRQGGGATTSTSSTMATSSANAGNAALQRRHRRSSIATFASSGVAPAPPYTADVQSEEQVLDLASVALPVPVPVRGQDAGATTTNTIATAATAIDTDISSTPPEWSEMPDSAMRTRWDGSEPPRYGTS